MQTKFLKSSSLLRLVSIVDVFFSLFVVAPLVVGFWSTVFMLYDMFIAPNNTIVSATISWSFGFCGQMILIFYQDSIKSLLHFKNHKLVNILLSKVYALLSSHLSASYWRGIWCFVDAISTNDIGLLCLNIVQNITILVILRSFTNTVGSPFIIAIDGHQPEQYNAMTLLRKNKANGHFMYFIDCLATMFVGALVAFVWRDLWFFQDSLNIFPEDPFYSALASLVFGYSLALICFASETFVGILYDKYDNLKLLFLYTFTMVALVSSMNVWRGLWLFVAYFAGDKQEWILILNTLAWVILMLVNCSFSLFGNGIVKDAENTGKFCLFQTKYLSQILFKETEQISDSTCTISTRM